MPPSSFNWIPSFSKEIYVFIKQSALHYSDVRMGAIASQITSLTIVYSTVYSGADQRKHQSSASLSFVRGIHRRPVISPHKWPVTRKMLPFDDVIVEIILHRATAILFHGWLIPTKAVYQNWYSMEWYSLEFSVRIFILIPEMLFKSSHARSKL